MADATIASSIAGLMRFLRIGLQLLRNFQESLARPPAERLVLSSEGF
jgi:hypothetical protein